MRLNIIRHPPLLVQRPLCYGRLDIPLAPGWDEIVSFWPRIGDIHASPQSRCCTSASLLGRASLDARLMELNFGRWEGCLWDQIPRGQIDAWAADPLTYRIGGGETLTELHQRISAFWSEIYAKKRDCTIVTHGGPIRVLIALATHCEFDAQLPTLGFGEWKVFDV